jgi:hypothetical protein
MAEPEGAWTLGIFFSSKMRLSSDGGQIETGQAEIEQGSKLKSLQKSLTTPLEASLWTLLVTPPVHYALLKVMIRPESIEVGRIDRLNLASLEILSRKFWKGLMKSKLRIEIWGRRDKKGKKGYR